MANRIPPAAAPKSDIVPLGNYGTRICPKGYAPEGNAHTGYVRCESADHIDRTSAVGVIGGTALMIGAPFVGAAALDSGTGYVGTLSREGAKEACDLAKATYDTVKDPARMARAIVRGVPGAVVADYVVRAVNGASHWVMSRFFGTPEARQ